MMYARHCAFFVTELQSLLIQSVGHQQPLLLACLLGSPLVDGVECIVYLVGIVLCCGR